MITVARSIVRTTAKVVPVAQLARLGMPALIVAGVLAVLAIGTVWWIMASDERADRLTQVLGAWRGNVANGLPPERCSDPQRVPDQAGR